MSVRTPSRGRIRPGGPIGRLAEVSDRVASASASIALLLGSILPLAHAGPPGRTWITPSMPGACHSHVSAAVMAAADTLARLQSQRAGREGHDPRGCPLCRTHSNDRGLAALYPARSLGVPTGAPVSRSPLPAYAPRRRDLPGNPSRGPPA